MKRTVDMAMVQVLAEAMAADPTLELLVEADGPHDELPADRVRRLPISDRGTMGVAVGLALGGKRPVVQLASTGDAIYLPVSTVLRKFDRRPLASPLTEIVVRLQGCLRGDLA